MRAVVAIAVMLVTACRTVPAAAEHPAWIAMPDPATRAEVERAIKVLVGNREIRLAADVLTSSHVLLLEPAGSARLEGRTLGRNLGIPERLELIASGRRCYLVHSESGRRERLRGVTCVPAGRE